MSCGTTSALALMLAKPTLMSLAQYGTRPQRSMSRLRSLALRSCRTTGSMSVGATFQLGGKFGIGRCGGIENTSLISLTSEERRTRPHMFPTIAWPPADDPRDWTRLDGRHRHDGRAALSRADKDRRAAGRVWSALCGDHGMARRELRRRRMGDNAIPGLG